jgi:hypothetical protein
VIHRAAAALAVVFVLAHLPFLPASLEDIDSVNFALGVRDFDIAQHRPHPPGYPIYIAVAKGAVAVAGVVGHASQSAREAKAMGVVSLAGAIAAILLLFRLFASFTDETTALAATALTAACPLFWYMAVRPMSDMVGLAAALASLLCAARAWTARERSPASNQMIVLAALLAALAIGVRSQNAMVTLPFLGAVLMDRVGKGVAGPLLGGAMAFAIGVLVWAVPLIVASGGLNAYLAALGSQAGEDFAGVDMLYLNPSPRLAADALVRTLIYPWDSWWLGGIVLALAVAGSAVLLIRDRRTLIALVMITAPYLAFHLLFHDMDFVRYALPIVPALAFLAVVGAEMATRQAALPVVGALAVWGVVIATPVLNAYTSQPSPVVRANDPTVGERLDPGSFVLGMHQTFQRPLEAEIVPFTHRLPSPPRREWLELVRYWRDGTLIPVWFLADPRRTDLALIDPRSRARRREVRWGFASLSQMGGMRPSGVDRYLLSPPGWFAEEGWALTPETAGIARAMQRGPHLAPITAWVRRRAGATRMLVGGRHLGSGQDGPVTFTAAVDGKPIATWQVEPGFFLNVFDLPAGTLAGYGLARLELASGGGGIATAIEQFDLQDAGSLMWGYGEGWNEAEYNPRTGLWRWASERATLRLIDPSTPVAVRLQIESPRRYFDAAPHVRLTAGGHVVAEATPDSGFVLEGVIPLDVLRAAGGLVTLETDRVFVPAEQGGSDQRRLGLRVFGVGVSIRN